MDKYTKNNVYKNVAMIFGGAVIGASMMYFANNSEPTPIKAEGFPKGFKIENVDIKTRGDITRVKKLPDEIYKDTIVDGKPGYVGNFEYEIEPVTSAIPKDDYHSDMGGHTLKNNAYWTDIRRGVVTGSIDDKLVK
jgi:hypothetical protein